MDENATSSSRNGAMRVHSESRQPRTSSSSASSRSRSTLGGACELTSFLQLHLERVAVHAAVVAVEDVGDVRLAHLHDRLARDHPEGERLRAPAVELPRVGVRERPVRRLERAAVLERRPLPLLAAHLSGGHYATPASTTRRPRAVSSRERRRNRSRSSVFGPWPV